MTKFRLTGIRPSEKVCAHARALNMRVGLALRAGREQDMSKKVTRRAGIASLSLDLAHPLARSRHGGRPSKPFSNDV